MSKSFSQLDDQSDGQFGQFGRPGQFFRYVGVAGCQHFTSLKCWEVGPNMIFTENVKFRSGSG